MCHLVYLRSVWPGHQAQVTTFYKNDEQVVAQRREGLQRYLNTAVSQPPTLAPVGPPIPCRPRMVQIVDSLRCYGTHLCECTFCAARTDLCVFVSLSGRRGCGRGYGHGYGHGQVDVQTPTIAGILRLFFFGGSAAAAGGTAQ
jgi:hypothetical protein|eukprot:COSAG06_NODE_7129_length_2620_cov_2.201507_2_plen_143_part_00